MELEGESQVSEERQVDLEALNQELKQFEAALKEGGAGSNTMLEDFGSDRRKAEVEAEEVAREKKEEAQAATKAVRKKYLICFGILGIASVCLHQTLSQPGQSARAAALILRQHSVCSRWPVVPQALLGLQGQWRGCWL